MTPTLAEWSRRSRAAFWADRLTRIPSTTGTDEEAAFGALLATWLRESPAFAGDGGTVWTLLVPGGAAELVCVCALLRRGGRATAILSGHYDTVHADDYGPLQPLARAPDRLHPALLAALAAAADGTREARVRDDLRSGAFLPGRGLLDMKAGLAAAIAAAERFAADPDASGNLLLIAAPDEEGQSAGARAAAVALPAIAAAHGLDLRGVINLDAIGDDGDGTGGRAVAFGTVGKLAPFALVVGEATHACYARGTVNAAALAGALAADLEGLPSLTERSGDEVSSGLTVLEIRDDKSGYDVTTPGAVFLLWNLTLHRLGAEAVLRALLDQAQEAARAYAAALGARVPDRPSPPPIPVVSYAALTTEALARDPATATDAIAAARAEAGRSAASPAAASRRVAERVWSLSGRRGPAVVIGFATLPYPATDGDDAPPALRRALADAATRVAERHGTTIRTTRFFPAICDLSFLGAARTDGLDVVAANTPMPTGLDPGAPGTILAVNAGPWGRDYHTPYERVHAAYAFDVLPDLVLALVRSVLDAADRWS